jgi:hypothetical protein
MRDAPQWLDGCCSLFVPPQLDGWRERALAPARAWRHVDSCRIDD